MNTANWLPDLSLKVQNDEDWYMFSPSDVRDLHDLYGDKFDKRYKKYCKLADEGQLENHRVIKAELMEKNAKSIV